MKLEFRALHPLFAAEVSPVDLATVTDRGVLDQIRAGLDRYAVLVFRDQAFSDEGQTAFTQRLREAVAAAGAADGQIPKARDEALDVVERGLVTELQRVSNVADDGRTMARDDRRRVAKLGNRIWHTDGSSVSPSGRYTLLSGRLIPPVRADTEFADMRAAYDALDEATRQSLEGLSVYHSLVYSRHLLGFEFSPEEKAKLKGAIYPLVRTATGSGRRSLYIGAHSANVVEMPVPEGRLLLRDLTEHATQPQFVYRHEWRQNDLLIWDNHATLHRARPFDDGTYGRDMRRTVITDPGELPAAPAAAGAPGHAAHIR